MSEAAFRLVGWDAWLSVSPYIKSRLGDANESNARDYFARIHPLTETMLRRILLVGLRRNEVTFKAAQDWLFEDNAKLTRAEFPRLFDKLYQSHDMSWDRLLGEFPELNEIWILWISFSKGIRNHVLHGARSYSDEWLWYAIGIDQAFIMLLDTAMAQTVGGHLCQDLRKLRPRLPKGVFEKNFIEVTGVKKRRMPSPPLSLVRVEEKMSSLSMFTPRIGITVDSNF